MRPAGQATALVVVVGEMMPSHTSTAMKQLRHRYGRGRTPGCSSSSLCRCPSPGIINSSSSGSGHALAHFWFRSCRRCHLPPAAASPPPPPLPLAGSFCRGAVTTPAVT